MFVASLSQRVKRRGIILVVILGMLGLLALIGVTFATFSGQALINARNFSQAQQFPSPSEVMDFALSQLIDDTANPQSALRGHSLNRDMYGNDAVNNAGPLTTFISANGSTLPFQFTSAIFETSTTTRVKGIPTYGLIKCQTNAAWNTPSLYGYDFTRWTIHFVGGILPTSPPLSPPTYLVPQSYEVVIDDATGSIDTTRDLYLAAPNPAAVTVSGTAYVPPHDPSISGYVSPELIGTSNTWTSTLIGYTGIPLNVSFTLHGSYLRAFNGSGMAGMGSDGAGHSLTEYANFKFNGNILNNAYATIINASPYTPTYTPGFGNPNAIPASMDEDYDAPDLENWFLALQSADGKVVVPSFHRPGILAINPQNANDNDWTRTPYLATTPAQQLLATRAMSKILRPRAVDGHNPISFPNLLPSPINGQITYDVDNDGDGTTDSVWLDLGYPPKRSPDGQLFKPLFAFMVIGLNGRIPLNTAGNLARTSGTFTPRNDHTEHLGNSPSEIDLRFGLQNAFDGTNLTSTLPYENSVMRSQFDNAGVSQPYDSRGVPVSRTQARNILAGTRPYDPNGQNPTGDQNIVYMDGIPYILPNGVGDAGDITFQDPNTGSLAVMQNSPPIPGRWGEKENVPGQYAPNVVDHALPMATGTAPNAVYLYTNPIRAGYSVSTSGGAFDTRDDNFNSFDFYPNPSYPLGSLVHPESADYYDMTGSLSLPVERYRRFVSPLDLNGDGRITTFNGNAKRLGGDWYGRVSFNRYFRPPGVPIQTALPLNAKVTDPAPSPPPHDPTTPAPLIGNGTHAPVNPDISNNHYHGFEAALNPSKTIGINHALQLAGMPADIDSSGNHVPTYSGATNITPPTFDLTVNSSLPASTGAIAGVNEADEMNLYTPSRLDAPFGVGDLEWLYRYQDVDGGQLESRLAQLAPISFLNKTDGQRRRRLFSVDVWETNHLIWANDNPPLFAHDNNGVQQAVYPFHNNSRFQPYANAGLLSLNNIEPHNLDTSTGPVFFYGQPRTEIDLPFPVNVVPTPVDPAFDFSPQHETMGGNSFGKYPVTTPSVAHRDRKINLNFPLPVSNSPTEPIRQKWIRETYQFFKAMLPPKAIDTPEELAQLSQYVINLVDFRDPDGTTTEFVNTDIVVVPPANASATVQSTLEFSTASPPTSLPAYDPQWLNTAANPNNYLVQYGMEYQPVAINEVLAINFFTGAVRGQVGGSTPPNDNRLLIELVNTLTKDAISNNPDTSDLDLTGWDFVIMPDDALGRPDPFTGQLPPQGTAGHTVTAYPLNGAAKVQYMSPPAASPTAPTSPTTGLATPVPALTSAAGQNNADKSPNYYYVFGNSPMANKYGMEMMNPINAPVQVLDMTAELKSRQNAYYWLYLRRPPNPFDTHYDASNPNANRVVVDSFRFLYLNSTGSAYTSGVPPQDQQGNNPSSEVLFSLQRMQPFRGGHAVPPLSGVSGLFLTPAFGYSEQTAVAPPRDKAGKPNIGTYGWYGTTPGVVTTGEIRHSLGYQANSKTAPTATGGAPTIAPNGADQWDYLPFNDRDYSSVVELLMVPSTSPGLFTKQFAEVPPPLTSALAGGASGLLPVAAGSIKTSSWTNTPWPVTTAAGSSPTVFQGNSAPHPFPYLNDEFFYSAVSEPLAGAGSNPWPEPAVPAGLVQPYHSPSTNNYIGGPSGAGWFKMLDAFEVPSLASGAIGPVGSGSNYDWMRQDTKPGLLNLNLIIDEEVFLGLMGETSYGQVLDQTVTTRGGFLNQLQVAASPAMVNLVDDTGTPVKTTTTDSYGNVIPQGIFPMSNVGITDNNTVGQIGNLLKACFADFLAIRHGGSGFIFGFGNGTSGSLTPLASERPFRSFSSPDVNATILRPATLPPSPTSTPNWNTAIIPPWATAITPQPTLPAYGSQPTSGNFVWDPGVKNPYLYTSNSPTQPPPIPVRRLFQVPDFWGTATGFTGVPSNASPAGDPNVGTLTQATNLHNTNGYADLTQPPIPGNPSATPPIPATNVYLGGGSIAGSKGPPVVAATPDQRDHPYFRTEWLQKVANLTTVRTHQYAVWITVGFFEVTAEGDATLANNANNYTLAYDKLGLELGVLEGRNDRYRGFFIVDRTKAIGFNPSQPGNFRTCVVYRNLIE